MGKRELALAALVTISVMLAGCGAGGQELPASAASGVFPASAAAGESVEHGIADFSFEGTVFTYDGESYDLTERWPSVTAVMDCTPVGDMIVVEGHVGPKNGYYGIFNTESRTFVKDLAGCNLIWRDNDITTAVYSFWGDICDYNGNILATAALGEGDYIYDLAFQDGGARLAVTIESGGGEGSTAVIDLPA